MRSRTLPLAAGIAAALSTLLPAVLPLPAVRGDVLLEWNEPNPSADEGRTATSVGDDDGDGVSNRVDNCPGSANPVQADADRDGLGDVCDRVAARFVRGDVEADGQIGISDAIRILCFVFDPGEERPIYEGCRDAADVDDNGSLQVTDAILLLGYLFLGGEEPSAPFPEAGIDETQDDLACELATGA